MAVLFRVLWYEEMVIGRWSGSYVSFIDSDEETERFFNLEKANLLINLDFSNKSNVFFGHL